MVGRLYGMRSKAAAKATGGKSCWSASASPTPATASPRPTRAACAAGSTSPPRSSPTRRPSCSSTSRRRASIHAAGSSSGRRSRSSSRQGTTVLLTTQYLEEADRLADEIAVIDHGKVIARGHLRAELKDRVGGRAASRSTSPRAPTPERGGPHGGRRARRRRPEPSDRGLARPRPGRPRERDDHGGRDAGLTGRGRRRRRRRAGRPTLDDVFLALTGHEIRIDADDEQRAEDDREEVAA